MRSKGKVYVLQYFRPVHVVLFSEVKEVLLRDFCVKLEEFIRARVEGRLCEGRGLCGQSFRGDERGS